MMIISYTPKWNKKFLEEKVGDYLSKFKLQNINLNNITYTELIMQLIHDL